MKWVGHVARIGHKRNIYNTLIGKSEVKRKLGRLRRRWEDNIRADLKKQSEKFWIACL
jgi:hypothetical protein